MRHASPKRWFKKETRRNYIYARCTFQWCENKLHRNFSFLFCLPRHCKSFTSSYNAISGRFSSMLFLAGFVRFWSAVQDNRFVAFRMAQYACKYSQTGSSYIDGTLPFHRFKHQQIFDDSQICWTNKEKVRKCREDFHRAQWGMKSLLSNSSTWIVCIFFV